MIARSIERQDGLQEFEFEIVTVNRQGEIVERKMHEARQFTEDLGNGIALEMVLIPGGMFRMGSREGEGYADERPQHIVRVAPFLMGKYPVTQEQWAAVMKWTPPYRGKGARRPVDRVSWDDAGEFCEQLAKKTGRAYRLPSEAQWEYACRAGTTTPFYFGETITTDMANYVGEHTYLAGPKGVYRHESTVVGSFPPNAFGLYDMHGNIWEWCADAWHDDYNGAPGDGSVWERGGASQRVMRGGGWHEPPDLCRSAARLKFNAAEGEDFVGFRVALPSLERQEGNPVNAIPRDVALRLCEEIRRENRGKWYTFNGLWCWGCATFTGGDPEKMCVSGPDYRGCAQVNTRFARRTRQD